MIEKYKNILFNLVPDISLAMIILLGFIIGGIIIKSIITSKLLKQKGNPALIKLIGNAVKNIFIILGIISAFGTLGIDVSAMIAGLGLTGFAL